MITAEVADELAVCRRRIVLGGADDAVLDLYDDVCDKAAAQDRVFFAKSLVTTVDEHDRSNPFKKLPSLPDENDYVGKFVAQWDRVANLPKGRKKILLVHKSRQMQVSWMAAAMALWECMYLLGRLVVWQSKKAEDADRMLGRIFGVWERLPVRVRRLHPCERRYMELRFPASRCDVYAIPQGPDQLRQYVPSLLISDEMAFQEEALASYVASLPAIEGDGMFVGISSAAPGHFANLVLDKEDGR